MSKKLNFSVNIDDDELFDKSVKEAFRNYAKQIVREEINKEYEEVIRKETERAVNNLFSNSQRFGWQREPRINEIVKSIADSKIREIFKESDVSDKILQIAKEKSKDYLDSQLLHRVDESASAAARLEVRNIFKNYVEQKNEQEY